MATGTKLMKEISDQFLICKICLEPFKDPKTLSCLHTFCCACVQQQYDAESNRPTRYTLYARAVTCPVCRKKTELPTGGVRRLPDNFLVSNLTDVLAKRRCVSKVPPCEICHTMRSRSSDACSKCLDCDKLLCRACVDLHSSTKVTQDHSLIDLEGQKDIECKAHPEETVRFYCEKCEECICVVCTFQEHKDHDVCSFNDGFAKHKVSLEGLLGRSRERLTGVSRRLKVIEKYETLSKELKERIRDLAISYTSQVRAREKELIKKVDDLFSGEVTQLAEKKAWLQESFDSLQSACNLTEIVMKDKGVEMLLLKKEIQGKMDQLLGAALPPEPPDLRQLDVTFVPGEVKLGEFFVPGKGGERIVKDTQKSRVDKAADKLSSDVREGIINASPSPCIACFKRKRQEEREGRGEDEDQSKEKKRKATKSVYIQTRAQEPVGDIDRHNGHFTTTASQVNAGSTGVSVSHNSMQTHAAIVSSRCAGTDTVSNCSTTTDSVNTYNTTSDRPPPPPHVVQRARGTMTARQDVRTLKIQTDESCLRDIHLGQAASTGSTYPNTGAAIAAAFLKQATSEENALAKSWPMQTEGHHFSAKETHDAEVATDISLGLTDSISDAIAALCRGEVGAGLGVNGTDHRKPDLLAETGIVPVPTPPSSPWIRTRKVQTEISALSANSTGEEQCITDEELRKSLLVSSGSTSRKSSTKENQDSMSLTSSPVLAMSKGSPVPRVSCCDVGVMTTFNVKLVQDSVDKDTSTEAVTSNCIGVMTSLETRTVYIQTLRKRLASTATGTDYEGQMSKSTATQPVSSIDAETTMPQVLHETRTTWTDALMTSERATCTEGPETTDAVTLTTQVVTNDFTVQMRPETVVTSTNTLSPRMVHHQSQTAPTLLSTGTNPDSTHLQPPQTLESSSSVDLQSADASAVLWSSDQHGVLTGQLCTVAGGDVSVKEVERVDVAVETESPQFATIATGPSSQMQSCRTASTDTLHLLQVSDRETCTPTVKTVDDWTYTPQPQMINTGVTPLRPAVLEVGVATTPVTLMDQATYTEVKTFRDSGTENCLVVCDNETLTEKTVSCDAQTGVDINTESQGTSMDIMECTDGSCMTEKYEEAAPAKETHDTESQCQHPVMMNKEVNTTRFRRKAREAQTSFSYMECMLCEHPEKLEQLAVTKTFTDTSTDPSPPDTHDVATMALSCLASPPGLVHTGVQTSATQLYDKEVATSFDFDEDIPTRPFLGLECQDAATSTESLPYIGLLSEIDVDELIVIPEANFELVSDSDEDCVSMVDDETLTEVLDYVEVGTQTVSPTSGSGASIEESPVLVRPEDDCSKHLVSIGVNTMPKVTFEKETSTPIRHLFSKGTMTFFVAKMDKATSTISQIRSGDSRQGASGGGGRVVKEASKHRATDSKVTMTNRAEQRDMAVETDSALMDGRITQCISKLRNVSERLNSPTLRKTLEGDVFFGQSFLAHKQKDSNLLASPSSPKVSTSPTMPPRDSNVFLLSPPKDSTAEEAQRQTQLHNLLVETDAVLVKSKDLSPVRKAQPITTLKPRSPVTPGDVSHYASKSLPRPRSLDRQNKVKMGSKATSPSRLPLLRYNSAPERIAAVPAQTLMMKTGQTSPRASPSRIPVSQKQAATPSSTATSDSGPDSDTYSTSSSQKVQQRPSLPSISETRTPSSCSDSSFVSIESGGSSLNPPSVMTTSHSRTPSNVTSVSDTTSEVTQPKGSAEALSTEVRESTGEDSSSVNSTSTALMVTPQTQESNSSPGSSGKHKKEKKGFMKRFLGGKKKKDSSSSECEKEGTSKAENSSTSKQQPASVPASPQVQKKQAVRSNPQQGARPKKPQKSDAPKTSSSPATATKHPPPPVSTPASSRPSSADSTHTSTKGGAFALPAAASAAAASLPMPPHHYPPLPDPNKTPPPPRKPRPFVYVRQRIFSIQQDNVEEVKERKEKEKEEKEKGKTRDKEQVKVTEVTVNEKVKVKESLRGKVKDEKVKEKTKPLCSVRAVVKSEKEVKGKEVKGKEVKETKTVEKGKGVKMVKKAEKITVSKPEKSDIKDKKDASKPRGWVCGK